MTIDQQTQVYGIVGHPIGHTLSPVMHNAAFSALGLNAVYVAFETEDLKGSIQGVRALDIKGLSVTIPYKSAILPLIDHLDGLADKIGAVNTVVNKGGTLVGYNTDASGALKALEEMTDLGGKTCLIVGAGGAARAIGFILREKGLPLAVTNRSTPRGEGLADALGCPFFPLNEIRNFQADIVIQTTPVGMVPQDNACLLSPDALREGMVVMDMVYNPPETVLLKRARSKSCVTVPGLGMFIHQGAEQFRLWTGLEPPVDIMRRAVGDALRRGR